MFRLLLMAVILAMGGAEAPKDDFGLEPPPKPSWDDEGEDPFGPEEPPELGPRDDREPPPEPREGVPPPERYAWIVGGVAGIGCLVLLALLLRESTRGRREAATKLSLLASVSHEFRTPLTNLRLYAEMLESAPSLPERERARYLRIISDETARLARLVDNVLDYGRITERRRTYAQTELDLPRLLRDIIAKQEPRVKAAGMALTLGGDAERTVRGDADAIRQVVNNLIDNAVKYAAEGGAIDITVGADSRGARDSRACLPTSPYVEVADRGPGIAKGNVRHLFDRFWRAERSLASDKSGAGLGLFIARNLMRGMGGDLVYRDNPAGGSVFRAEFHG